MDKKAWIVVSLCVIGMIVNGWWMVKNPPPPPPPPPAPAQQSQVTPPPVTPPAAVAPAAVPTTEQKVELKNEKAAYTFTTKGGGIAEVVLLDTKDRVRLNHHGKAAIGSLSSAAKSYADLDYRITAQTERSITFEAVTPDQILVRKAYSFSTGPGASDHLLDFTVTLVNQGGSKITRDNFFLYTGAAAELRPDEIERPAFCWNNAGDADYQSATKFREGAGFLGFGGPILEYQESFNRLRWAGVMSRFYTSLIATREDMPTRVWAERFLVDHSNDEFKDNAKAGQDYAIHGGFSLAPAELEPGVPKGYDLRIYLGPKIYHDLKKIDESDDSPGADRQLRDAMFYGKWFGWVSRILVAGLRFFHDWTGNWGVAIILLTIAVRSLLWPLQARSNKQMKKMGKLSPMLKELQEKYKDDQQRFAQEQMKLFREYGVNPVGGCLPLLIQFPIFIGFYTVLRFATELRGQPFIAWVQDLSLPDTVYTIPLGFHLPFVGSHFDINPLPILMGLTMWLQMKLTPQPSTVDPMQKRIFALMPFLFLFFCYGFASALALYWTFTNIFMIVQAQITRFISKDDDAPLVKVNPGGDPPSGGGGLFGGAPASPSQQPKKKAKPGPPRAGGGGTRSTRPRGS